MKNGDIKKEVDFWHILRPFKLACSSECDFESTEMWSMDKARSVKGIKENSPYPEM